MIILTPFGTTTGLEVVPLPLSSDIPPIKFEDAWIEVTGGQITLRSGKDAYVVLRKQLGQQVATWIGLYRLAREIGYDRPGSFYGAGAWLIGCTTDTRALLDMLRDMADQIQSKAMSGDRFIKRIDQVRSELVAPPQVNAVISSVAKVGAGCLPSGGNAFIVATANHLEIIDWAQNAPSASPYCRVIVGNAEHAPSTFGQTSLSVYQSLASAIDGAYLRVVSDFNQARSLAETHSQQLTQSVSDLEKKNAYLGKQIQDITAKFNEQNIKAADWYNAAKDLQRRLEISEQINKNRDLLDRNNSGQIRPLQSLPGGSNWDGFKQPHGVQPLTFDKQRSPTQNPISYNPKKESSDDVWWYILWAIFLVLFLLIAIMGLGYLYRNQVEKCWFFNYVSCQSDQERQVQRNQDQAYPNDRAQNSVSNPVNGPTDSVRSNLGSGQSIGNPAGVKKP